MNHTFLSSTYVRRGQRLQAKHCCDHEIYLLQMFAKMIQIELYRLVTYDKYCVFVPC